VVALSGDNYCIEATSKLNVSHAQICTHIEREFLQVLEGGCTAPIGAIAKIIKNEIQFKGVLFSLDGHTKLEIEKSISIEFYPYFGKDCAQKLLENRGKKLMEQIKKEVP